MNLIAFRLSLCFFLIALQVVSHAQVKKKIREFKSYFQFSLFPGISTNGIVSGNFVNKYSINLFGGLSGGNRIFEVGLITNLNTKSSTGIQLAGLANIIGANAFLNLSPGEETILIKEGFESNSIGVRIAGFLNYVRNHSSGIELAGAFNLVGDNFKGFQLSGIGNTVGGYSEGFQLAALYNTSRLSLAGFQVSMLFNTTNGLLAGGQIGMVNRAGLVGGRKTRPLTMARGFQIGLLNFSKRNDGIQIGLFNWGGDAHGTQIGLINFFSAAPAENFDVKRGTPVGLLNFGTKGSYLRFYTNEMYTTNMEFTTGNCTNCSGVFGSDMPIIDRNRKFNQNTLIVGFSPQQNTWGFGYGFQKVLYNKEVVRASPLNEKRILNYGVKFLHLNRDMNFDTSFNLLNKFNFDYGKRMGKFYLFVSVSLNYFLYQPEDAGVYKIRSVVIQSGNFGSLSTEIWPGYAVGIQIL